MPAESSLRCASPSPPPAIHGQLYISPLWQLFKTQKLQKSLGSWLNIYRPVHFVLLPGCLDLGFSHIEPIQKAKPKPAAGVTQLNIDSVIKYKLQIGNIDRCNHRKQTSPPQAAPLWRAVDPSCVKSSHGSASYCNDDNSRIFLQTNRHPNSLEWGPCPLGEKMEKKLKALSNLEGGHRLLLKIV